MWKVAYLVIVLRLLVLYKKFQPFLPDLRLDVTAAPVAFLNLGFLILSTLAFFLRLIRLTDHFRFAVSPDDGHASLGILDMPNLVSEIGVRLTT
jgi:hypothetical protein